MSEQSTFGQVKDHYSVAVCEPDRFHPPTEDLPDGLRLVIGRSEPDLVEQERRLIAEVFPSAAPAILAGDLDGWRPDTPMFLVDEDGTLVTGGYLFAVSEVLPEDGHAEFRYVFTRPEWRRAGLLHHLMAFAVERTGEWGMRALTGSVDRAGLAEVYEGWGGRIVEVRHKEQVGTGRKLVRRVKRRLTVR